MRQQTENATQSEEDYKKKERKKIMELTRDLISFNLYLIFYLPRLYNRSYDISHCLFLFPSFSLFRVSLVRARIILSLSHFLLHSSSLRFNFARSLSLPFLFFFLSFYFCSLPRLLALSVSRLYFAFVRICYSLVSRECQLTI